MIGSSLGRYRIEAELGRGGMSVVYRAHDPTLGRKVAVKVLHPHLADRPDARERFTREARAVARLSHPNIVEVFDYAPPESDRAYIVTEYIDGPTLRAFVEDHPVGRAEVAALLMVPVFEALHHAHDAGVVHRDVKPENIMLRPDGSPVLMDFGIAQMVDMETLTATGTILGSPAHMAPEVVEGEEAGPRADIFSAGTVLYWLVCGALPFSGPNPAALFRRILECRFDPVLQRRPHAGRALARLIEQCLQRSPAARPADARQVAESLRSLLAEGGLTEAAAERAAFYADPEVYQDGLVRRLVPAYLAAARRAIEGSFTARALDFLDRVLALDADHPEAQALLARIERGRRRARVVRRGLAAAGVAAAVAGAGLLVHRVAGGDDPADAGPVAVAGADGSVLPVAVVVDAGARAAVDAAPPDVVPVDAAPVDAAPPDAAPPDARPDAARRQPVAARRPTSPRRPPPAPQPPTDPDASPPTPARLVEVPIRVDNKSVRIVVDGKVHGFAAEVDATKPVRLPPGRHVIRFEHPACREDAAEVVIGPDQTRVAPVVYRCEWRPAYFRVRSNRTASIRDSESGQILGWTNQTIPYEMTRSTTRVRLIIQGPEGSVSRELALVAGQRHDTEVQF